MKGRIVNYSSAIVGNPWKNWFFLKLQTEDGLTGIGEASLNGFVKTVGSAVDELKEYFVGESAFEVNKIVEKLLVGVYSDGGQIHRSAISAIESACWDIVGKSLEQPVWNLWGGRVRERIKLYANGWYQTERDPDAFAEKSRQVISMGYQAMKFDPFGDIRGGLDSTQRNLSLEIIRAVRDAVPTGTELMVEGHCRLDVPSALQIAKELADLDVFWFEEPINHHDLKGLTEIAKRSPVRIATGENFTTYIEFLELCRESKNLVLQPDTANLGGLSIARQVCELGNSINVPVAPHDAQGPISKALCLQLAAISPAIIIQEDFEEFNPEWTRSISDAITKIDGEAIIPESPGLGRGMDWDLLSEYPYDPNATLALFEAGWEQRTGRSGNL